MLSKGLTFFKKLRVVKSCVVSYHDRVLWSIKCGRDVVSWLRIVSAYQGDTQIRYDDPIRWYHDPLGVDISPKHERNDTWYGYNLYGRAIRFYPDPVSIRQCSIAFYSTVLFSFVASCPAVASRSVTMVDYNGVISRKSDGINRLL